MRSRSTELWSCTHYGSGMVRNILGIGNWGTVTKRNGMEYGKYGTGTTKDFWAGGCETDTLENRLEQWQDWKCMVSIGFGITMSSSIIQ